MDRNSLKIDFGRGINLYISEILLMGRSQFGYCSVRAALRTADEPMDDLIDRGSKDLGPVVAIVDLAGIWLHIEIADACFLKLAV